MKSNQYNREIDLLDLLKVICYKWKALVCLMLICMVLGAGYAGVKNVSANRSIDASNEQLIAASKSMQEKKADAEDADEDVLHVYAKNTSLNDALVLSVKKALEAYKPLAVAYNELSKKNNALSYYGKDSVLNQYMITTEESGDVAENVADILNIYVVQGGLADNIISGGYDESVRYKVSVVNKKYADSMTEEAKRCSFAICISGETADDATKLATLVDESIGQFVTSNENLSGVKVELISQYPCDNTDLTLSRNTSDVSSIGSLTSTFNSLTGSFNDEQKALFNVCVGQDIFVLTDASIQDKIISGVANDITGEVVLTPHVSATAGVVKYALIGLFAGLFVGFCWFAFLYIISGTVKTESDFENGYGLYMIGDLAAEKKIKGFTKWLTKIFGDEKESFADRKSMISANIKALCQKNNISKICINSLVVLTDDDKAIANDFIDEMKKDGIEITFVGNVNKSSLAFENMVAIKNVVLLERFASTKYADMDKLAESCTRHEINVLGVMSI